MSARRKSLSRKFAVVCGLMMAAGCRRPAHYAPPEIPMPPNTVLLSQMMRELSAQPGFTEALLSDLEKGAKQPNGKGKRGPALLTPKLLDELRTRILGKDWSGLDRFPGWTMREINPTVRVVGHVVGKDEKLEELSAVHPGASPSAAQAREFLDLGPYALDKAQTVSLDTPSTLAPFNMEGIVTPLSANVTRGDGPNSLASEHAESQRLANVLNRLAANRIEGAKPFGVSRSWATLQALPRTANGPAVYKPRLQVWTPEEVIGDLQAAGHTVTVTDTRYFANFGHLHYKGQDVMAPFWIDTQTTIPRSNGRKLLIPVAHAEYEWHIRAPKDRPGIDVDVSYYFGVDGKSEWRTMDTLDQPWVLKRDAHTYTGRQAVEVTRLAAALTVAYMHLHAAHPSIPFGGYYAFGVCQDGVSAIEQKLAGSSTLFPNTADDAFFTDARDAEVNALMRAIPKDRDGAPPTPERVFGSLPADPGPNGDFGSITIPGLAADLRAVHSAWHDGSLHRSHRPAYAAVILILAFSTALVGMQIRRRRA